MLIGTPISKHTARGLGPCPGSLGVLHGTSGHSHQAGSDSDKLGPAAGDSARPLGHGYTERTLETNSSAQWETKNDPVGANSAKQGNTGRPLLSELRVGEHGKTPSQRTQQSRGTWEDPFSANSG